VAVVVQVSDTHLSRTHAWFHDNWLAFRDEMGRIEPDLIVHSGDVSFNGPDVPEDIAFARTEIGGLGLPFVAIPGNHDVGEPEEKARLGQPITDARRRVWHRHFGHDWLVRDIGDWRLVGLDADLMGSGLAAEAEQEAFVRSAFADADGRPIGLFVHKPLFLDSPDETEKTGKCVFPEPRRRLLALMERARVRFVASGHLHCYRHAVHDGVDHVWAPATSFQMPENAEPRGLESRPGYVLWRLEGERAAHELVLPPLFVGHDLSNWRQTRGSSIGLPPRPLLSRG
jgi:3',5'-cyclic AMP phosphodiesterase CpdA